MAREFTHRIVPGEQVEEMSRLVSVSRLVLPVSFLLLSGCGAPAPTTSPAGAITVDGPNEQGEFYVVGEANAAVPGESVTVINAANESVTVTADEHGGFAAHLWSAIDKSVDVQTQSLSIPGHPAHPELVNVNYATKRGLESVPGIGPVLAQRILDYRTSTHLFAEPADLADVSGIGASSVQTMLPWIESKIDVNTARKTWLEVLPMVGDVRATAIITYRDAHGAFHSVDDLSKVPGISATVLAAIRPYVKAGMVDPNPGSPLIDVNDADVDTLELLPGIGVVKAIAIIDWRNAHGLFKKVSDLLDVPGIGPATLLQISGHVTVGIPDPQSGTFAVEGNWTYQDGAGGTAHGQFPVESVLLSFEHEGSHLSVTVLGAGYGSDDPYIVNATVTSSAANGDFGFRLGGSMPSAIGDLAVTGAASGGVVTSGTVSIDIEASNAGRTWHATLTGYRILQ